MLISYRRQSQNSNIFVHGTSILIGKILGLTFASLLLTACNEPAKNQVVAHLNDKHADELHLDEKVLLAKSLYKTQGIIVADKLVPCTLSGGAESMCISIKVNAEHDVVHKMGPWCPRNVADSADLAGIWLDNDVVYDADGMFVKDLATFYLDDDWQLYDPKTGDIKVTDSKEACMAAARPDVDPKYQNYCVECLPSYVDKTLETTYLIPAQPIVTKHASRLNPHSGVGLAFNGVRLDAPAPVEAILGAHTLAVFDDCGGHVNLHAGYHYHAVTECSAKIAVATDHAAMLGFAMDGYILFSHFNNDGSLSPDLDTCGGHDLADLGYHYHVNQPGKNQILSCFTAQQGCTVDDDRARCDAKGMGPPPPRAG